MEYRISSYIITPYIRLLSFRKKKTDTECEIFYFQYVCYCSYQNSFQCLFFLTYQNNPSVHFAPYKMTAMKHVHEIFIGRGRRNISSSIIKQLQLRYMSMFTIDIWLQNLINEYFMQYLLLKKFGHKERNSGKMQFCDIHVNFLASHEDKGQNVGMHRRMYMRKCQLNFFAKSVFKGDKTVK